MSELHVYRIYCSAYVQVFERTEDSRGRVSMSLVYFFSGHMYILTCMQSQGTFGRKGMKFVLVLLDAKVRLQLPDSLLQIRVQLIP